MIGKHVDRAVKVDSPSRAYHSRLNTVLGLTYPGGHKRWPNAARPGQRA